MGYDSVLQEFQATVEEKSSSTRYTHNRAVHTHNLRSRAARNSNTCRRASCSPFCAFCAFLWLAFLCGFSWREPEGGQGWEIDHAVAGPNGGVAPQRGGGWGW